jgi:hypothetical protein
MTEAEWLASTDPEPMLAHLRGGVSDRKIRLVFCAWAREQWHRLNDERSREAVRVAECFADGLADHAELIAAANEARDACENIPVNFRDRHGQRLRSKKGGYAARAAANTARNAAALFLNRNQLGRVSRTGNAGARITLASILRELTGNPFRPVALDPAWLTWNNGAVKKMAQALYDESAFAEWPVLADALEDAGCANADLLTHLRGTEPHARGCWAIDKILGQT